MCFVCFVVLKCFFKKIYCQHLKTRFFINIQNSGFSWKVRRSNYAGPAIPHGNNHELHNSGLNSGGPGALRFAPDSTPPYPSFAPDLFHSNVFPPWLPNSTYLSLHIGPLGKGHHPWVLIQVHDTGQDHFSLLHQGKRVLELQLLPGGLEKPSSETSFLFFHELPVSGTCLQYSMPCLGLWLALREKYRKGKQDSHCLAEGGLWPNTCIGIRTGSFCPNESVGWNH